MVPEASRNPEVRPRRASRSPRGAVTLEYLVVSMFAGLVVSYALVGVAPEVVEEYARRRALLYQPVP